MNPRPKDVEPRRRDLPAPLFLPKPPSRLAAVWGLRFRIVGYAIRFANLGESDKLSDNKGAAEGPIGSETQDKTSPAVRQLPPNPSLPPQTGKVTLMENERVVFAHEIRPNQGFRIVVTGEVDGDMVAAMAAYAKFQEMLVKNAPPKTTNDEQGS